MTTMVVNRKDVNTVVKKPYNYSSDDAWGASWQAYVMQGNKYIKALGVGLTQKTNRQLVEELLDTPELITQESREQGLKMRNYFKGLMFNLIEGKKLNDFMQSAYDCACAEQVKGAFALGIVVCLPATYDKLMDQDEADRRIRFARGGYIGDVGNKVEATIEVIKQLWSQKWNTYYLTGITDDDKVLFFAYRNNIELGSRVTITGKVKAQRDTSTQLSNVKRIV